MLIVVSLPAGLAQTRDVAAHGLLAELVTAQAELAVVALRAPRQRATVGEAARARVARQLLQLLQRLAALFFRRIRRLDDFLQLGAADSKRCTCF